MLFVLRTFCFWILLQGIESLPEVKLSIGIFIGREETASICGCKYSSFKGIPYATPPLGNSNLYGPDFLMCYSVLLVTVNYRLGPLGFLSVDTEEVPGNAGMLDQVTALRWVKTNIHKFGGDPNKVTIFGGSAGGASVSLHILSQQSKGLFQRAISMSSTLFSDSSTSYKHLERAYALGSEVGCNNTDANELIDCLAQVPVKKLFEARPNIQSLDEISNKLLTLFYFTPIVEEKFNDKQFLTEHPGKLLYTGQVNEVEFMNGHTQSEGLWTTSLVIDDILKYYPKFKELYVPTMISNIRSDQEVSKLADRIRDNYITNKILLDSINGFVNYSTYSHYVYGIHSFNERYNTVNNKNQYFYVSAINASTNFCYQDGVNTFGIKKSTHTDELPLLFSGCRNHKMPVTRESDLYKYINLTCSLYTNFAKYGNPTLDMSWPSYGEERNFVYITDKLTVDQVRFGSSDLGFWWRIYQDANVTPYLS